MEFDSGGERGNSVRLSEQELLVASSTGAMRHIKKIDRKEGGNGADNVMMGWQYNCSGAIAEMAFAKWMGVYWDASVGTFRSRPDVMGYEIRSTYKPDWGLILRPRDLVSQVPFSQGLPPLSDQDIKKLDRKIYVLVLTYHAPRYEMLGWIKGSEAARVMKPERLDPKRKPAWVVGRGHLSPMRDLPIVGMEGLPVLRNGVKEHA